MKKIIILLLMGYAIFVAGLAQAQTTYCASAMAVDQAANTVAELLQTRAERHLTALCRSHQRQLETYFETIEQQLRYLAASPLTVAMLGKLQVAYPNFLAEQSQANEREYRRGLVDFYRLEFQQAYSQRNPAPHPNPEPLSETLSANSVALQYHYLATNSNPLGVKEDLDAARDPSVYSRLHAMYHTGLRDFVHLFNVEDLLLIDAHTNEVIYSVKKYPDFATSLLTGPYAQTGLAAAYQAARDRDGEIVLQDFAPYTPALDQPSAFMALSAIHHGKNAQAVIVARLSARTINTLLTHYRSWSAEEFGASGEVLLVGADLRLRSDVRGLANNPSQFLEQQVRAGTALAELDKIRAQDTTASFFTLENTAVRAALNGATGLDTHVGYHGEPVLSAFAPVAVRGVNWAMVAEIKKQEALAGVEAFQTQLRQALCAEPPPPAAVAPQSVQATLLVPATPAALPLQTLAAHAEILAAIQQQYHVEVQITPADANGGNAAVGENAADADAVLQFAQGQGDAIVVDNLVALQRLALAGVAVDAIFITALDYGHHSIVAKSAVLPAEGKILAVVGTIPHYLAERYLARTGLPLDRLRLTSAAELHTAWELPESVALAIEHGQLQQFAGQEGEGSVFDSRSVPAELMQLLLVRREALQRAPAIGPALIAAWLQAMQQPHTTPLPTTYLFTSQASQALKQLRDTRTLEHAMAQMQAFITRNRLSERAPRDWVSFPGSAPKFLHFNDQPLLQYSLHTKE